MREAGTEAEAEAAAEEETETTATATATLTHTLCRTCDSTVALAGPVSLPSTNEDTLLPGTVKSEDVESKTPTSASLNTRRCNSLTYDDAHACSPDTHTYKYVHLYIVCVLVFVCVRACVRVSVRACIARERETPEHADTTRSHTPAPTRYRPPPLHPTPTTTTTLPPPSRVSSSLAASCNAVLAEGPASTLCTTPPSGLCTSNSAFIAVVGALSH